MCCGRYGIGGFGYNPYGIRYGGMGLGYRSPFCGYSWTNPYWRGGY